MTRLRFGALALFVAVLLGACESPTPPGTAHSDDATGDGSAVSPIDLIVFTDATEASGVDFVHRNHATEERYLPETMGTGVAVFDLDGDDLPDLLFMDGAPVDGSQVRDSRAAGSIYRNLGDGRFEHLTALGINDHHGLGGIFPAMGLAVGDVDNDGRTDVFVSGVGEQRLYRNLGGGDFEDVTAPAGLRVERTTDDLGFGTSAAFFDADGDDLVDLYVGRYVPWTPETDVRCSPDGEHHTYCTPEVYDGAANVFYRNLGPEADGIARFEDQTAAWGLDQPVGKTLGVAVLDHDGDGRPDLAIANDTDRNHLFVQTTAGRYEEVGVSAGMAYSVSGATRGAMGIDAGDVNGDGVVDLAVGNFAQEMTAIYTGQSAGLYRDEAASLGIGLPSLMQVAFGTLLVDLDLDGRLDLVLANGHIEPEIRNYQSIQSYRQPLGVYRNLGETFEPITAPDGPLSESYVGRGLAAADLDGDGDLDLVLTQNGGPARILRNDAPPASWLRVRLEGTASHRTGYGAVVTVRSGGRTQRRALTSGRSYLSASEPVLTFGFGAGEAVESVEVRWPSGRFQSLEAPATTQLLILREPGGP